MPICQDKKLAFIHIPKTAGTTIETALGMKSIKNFYNEYKFKHYCVCPQHLTCEELSHEIDLADFELFTVVRNPYDRLVSEYNYIQNNEWLFKLKHATFKEFIKLIPNLDQVERKYIFDGHLETQSSFIKGYEDRIKIFHYEKINECFDYLSSKYGPLEFGLERKPIEKKNIKWTKELKKIVQSVYAEDFDRFNYKM